MIRSVCFYGLPWFLHSEACQIVYNIAPRATVMFRHRPVPGKTGFVLVALDEENAALSEAHEKEIMRAIGGPGVFK